MAPQKPETNSLTSMIALKTTSSDRVNKSGPKRGFHKYRNGLLNIKPKGKYIQITKKNRKQSPLLRLPAEIRNQIFEYILGNRIWQFPQIDKLMPLTTEDHTLGLLGVCRQIYAEAAVVPFQSGTFLLMDKQLDWLWLRNFARARLQAITTIRLDDQGSSLDRYIHNWNLTLKKVLPKLPGLKRIHVLNYLVRSRHENKMRRRIDQAIERETSLKKWIEDLAKDVEITFERKNLSKRAALLRSRRAISNF